MKSRLPTLHTSAVLVLLVPLGENKVGGSHARWSLAWCGAKALGALQVRKVQAVMGRMARKSLRDALNESHLVVLLAELFR